MVAKKTKKTAPVKSRVSSKKLSSVESNTLVTTPLESASTSVKPFTKIPTMKLNSKALAAIVVLIGVGALTYKLGPWMVPAIVGRTPITRWQMYERMEKNYGAQALDDMVNEKVLDLAIAKVGVKVDQSKIDGELAKIEEQFKAMGGLDEALKTRGLTKTDLVKQVTTQLEVEEILKDKITPSDVDIQKYFDDNSKTLYKDKKIDDVKAEISSSLKQSKLRDEFMTWFAEAKKGINVRNFSPIATPPVTQ
ncbi:MAG: hypothetical protein WCL07_03925 [bacterium]